MAKPVSGSLERVPPGQTVAKKWPVDTYGETPSFDPATWDFRVFGEVENPLRLTWEEFLKLPRVEGAGGALRMAGRGKGRTVNRFSLV